MESSKNPTIQQQQRPYSEEAAKRSAVSRAYYAAFCHARNYAVSKHGYVTTGMDDHASLREFFKKNKHAGIANDLNQLRNNRNDCDYRNQIFANTASQFMFTQSMHLARKILTKLS
jgi:hypothetical protein